MKFLLVAFLWTCWALPLARADDVAAGRAIAQDQYKGNCLACHRMPGDPSAVTLANLGPVLKDIRSRYPDRAELRRRVWDASTFNPDTIMPPYGRHRILTEQEIDAVVDYIRGL
ncbi:MAG: sulfur oxidation c-type cytochrome SoxX [Betaproteobacteria bacterium]|nr:sulfur oxidation c-type cytochrome SoxX [Betaproteobacteria bacterium]